ncbi:MAG: L,D-transpeptidase family protein [Cytophagaceae bacterium]|nr:L,D-transpeptidase family protein [Cytophagaceae bacterium]
MRSLYFFLPLVFLFFSYNAPQSFKTAQLKFPRVKAAYDIKEQGLKELLESKNLNLSSLEIFIRAFKKEEDLEVWGRKKGTTKFQLIKTYKICASSGMEGPKRSRGDDQVPEGFYHVNIFNPESMFHLSLGLNYPNQADRYFCDTNPGGDIYIHGNCITIGCMPMTDDKIKEIYIMALEAKNAGQSKINVHIFPCRLDEENMKELEQKHSDDKSLTDFWRNIKTGYDWFETNKSLPEITVSRQGKYLFN